MASTAGRGPSISATMVPGISAWPSWRRTLILMARSYSRPIAGSRAPPLSRPISRERSTARVVSPVGTNKRLVMSSPRGPKSSRRAARIRRLISPVVMKSLSLGAGGVARVSGAAGCLTGRELVGAGVMVESMDWRMKPIRYASRLVRSKCTRSPIFTPWAAKYGGQPRQRNLRSRATTSLDTTRPSGMWSWTGVPFGRRGAAVD